MQNCAIFKIETTRLFASLNVLISSLVQSPGKLWPNLALVGAWKWRTWDLKGLTKADRALEHETLHASYPVWSARKRRVGTQRKS